MGGVEVRLPGFDRSEGGLDAEDRFGRGGGGFGGFAAAGGAVGFGGDGGAGGRGRACCGLTLVMTSSSSNTRSFLSDRRRDGGRSDGLAASPSAHE